MDTHFNLEIINDIPNLVQIGLLSQTAFDASNGFVVSSNTIFTLTDAIIKINYDAEVHFSENSMLRT
jgi:hypothetical protein